MQSPSFVLLTCKLFPYVDKYVYIYMYALSFLGEDKPSVRRQSSFILRRSSFRITHTHGYPFVYISLKNARVRTKRSIAYAYVSVSVCASCPTHEDVPGKMENPDNVCIYI